MNDLEEGKAPLLNGTQLPDKTIGFKKLPFNTSYVSEAMQRYKPSKYHSFETIQLVSEELRTRPGGFRSNGMPGKMADQTLLRLVKRRFKHMGRAPKLAICITMYNEDVKEFKETIAGVI